MWSKFEDLLSALFEYVGMSLQVLMVLVVCFTILTRYFFSYTPAWGEATALLCMVWFGFLSIALGVRDEVHLSVTILDSYFPKRLQIMLAILKHFLILGCGVFMLYHGNSMVQIGRLNKLSGLNISSGLLYAAVPTCGFALVVYSLTHIFKSFKMYGDETREREVTAR